MCVLSFLRGGLITALAGQLVTFIRNYYTKLFHGSADVKPRPRFSVKSRGSQGGSLFLLGFDVGSSAV